MSWALYALLGVPLLAAASSALDGWRLARAATLVAGLVSLGLAIAIAITGSAHHSPNAAFKDRPARTPAARYAHSKF